jgi:hypothetical protein
MQVYYYFAIHSWQTHVSRVRNHGDEILIYGYVKPRDQWFPIKETPDRPLHDRLEARGLYPSGTLVHTLLVYLTYTDKSTST